MSTKSTITGSGSANHALSREPSMKQPFRTLIATFIISCCTLLSSGATTGQQIVPGTKPAGPTEPLVLMDITFESLPPAPAFVGVARLTFPATAGIVGGSIAGPRMFLIETGQFAVLADDPAIIWRQRDASQTEDLPAGAEATLVAGDLLIVHRNPPFTVVNTSDKPATLLDIVVWPPIAERIRPFVTEAGVIFEPLVIGDILQFPENPARVLLQRFSMPRSAESSFELDLGPQLLYVESGVLGIAAISGTVHYSSAASNAPSSVSGRLKTLEIGDEALLTAGGAALVQAGATGTIRNLGRTELDLLDLRFEPAPDKPAT